MKNVAKIFFSSDYDEIFSGYDSDDFKNFIFFKVKKKKHSSFIKSSDSYPKNCSLKSDEKKNLVIFFHDFRTNWEHLKKIYPL